MKLVSVLLGTQLSHCVSLFFFYLFRLYPIAEMFSRGSL
jgi:hypothetical protein